MGRKESGTGSIRQRKNGKWEGQYYLDGTRKSVYGNSYEEVRIKINTITAQILSGEYSEASGMPLKDWLIEWLKTYAKPTVRHSTYLTYEAYCHNHVIPMIGKKRMKQLSGEVLQQFFNSKSTSGRLDGEDGGLSPKSLQNIRNMLNLSFKQALMNRIIKENPIQAVKISRVEPKEMRVLDVSEQAALEKMVLSSLNDVAKGIIIALYTGVRIGELLGLQWQDVDLEHSKTIKVRRILVRQKLPEKLDNDYEILRYGEKTALMLGKVKTYKGYRTIYLPDIAVEMFGILKRYQQTTAQSYGGGFNPKGFVFCNRAGEPIEPRYYMDIFYGYVNSAGIPHANFHSLRHTFATRAMEMKMDINTLADMLGHAQPSTTLNMYGHSLDEQKRREMAKFNQRAPIGFLQQDIN